MFKIMYSYSVIKNAIDDMLGFACAQYGLSQYFNISW